MKNSMTLKQVKKHKVPLFHINYIILKPIQLYERLSFKKKYFLHRTGGQRSFDQDPCQIPKFLNPIILYL